MKKVIGPSKTEEKTGLSRVTLWRLEKSGQFPKRLNLTEARIGLAENEVDEWIESRPRGICNRQIRKEGGVK